MKRKLKVLIAAGGTGGHLFPAQQLTELLKEDCELIFAGYKLSQSHFFEKEKIPFREIPSSPIKKPLSFFISSLKGLWKSVSLIWKWKPDVVVGFGSYHSFPVLLAAALLRKKLVLFEANCILGKVNRLFLPAAETIALQFPAIVKKGVFVPMLPWKKKGWSGTKEEARREYGLDPSRKTILVFGGSQGASFLNEKMPEVVQGLDVQVLHLTGKGGKAEYSCSAVVKEFETEMGKAYAAADLVVCRSGAGSCAELIQFQKPSLLIPYPYAAEDHQRINGHFLTGAIGGGRMVIQKDATVERMREEIHLLWKDYPHYVERLKKVEQEKRADFGTIVRRVGAK